MLTRAFINVVSLLTRDPMIALARNPMLGTVRGDSDRVPQESDVSYVSLKLTSIRLEPSSIQSSQRGQDEFESLTGRARLRAVP